MYIYIYIYDMYIMIIYVHQDIIVIVEISGLNFRDVRFIPAATEEDGLLFDWPAGDKTLIQIDHGSINPEANNTEIMSLYRYLVLLERQKKVTKYDLSYSDITRQNGGDTDGFQVKISNGHKFKVMNDAGKTPTCKTWFGDSLSMVESSDVVQKVFRFRFDRVNACSKLQKPYVMLKRTLSLQVGRPVKAGLPKKNGYRFGNITTSVFRSY